MDNVDDNVNLYMLRLEMINHPNQSMIAIICLLCCSQFRIKQSCVCLYLLFLMLPLVQHLLSLSSKFFWHIKLVVRFELPLVQHMVYQKKMYVKICSSNIY